MKMVKVLDALHDLVRRLLNANPFILQSPGFYVPDETLIS